MTASNFIWYFPDIQTVFPILAVQNISWLPGPQGCIYYMIIRLEHRKLWNKLLFLSCNINILLDQAEAGFLYCHTQPYLTSQLYLRARSHLILSDGPRSGIIINQTPSHPPSHPATHPTIRLPWIYSLDIQRGVHWAWGPWSGGEGMLELLHNIYCQQNINSDPT